MEPNVSECWEDEHTMLNRYIHDYLLKRNMHETARIFKSEAAVEDSPAMINDSSEGFLHEWWSLFYDQYNAQQPAPRDVEQEANAKDKQIMTIELDNALIAAPVMAGTHQRQRDFPPRSNSGNKLKESETFAHIPSRFHPNQHATRGDNMGSSSQINLIAEGQTSVHPIAEHPEFGQSHEVNTMQITGWPWNFPANDLPASIYQQELKLMLAQELCIPSTYIQPTINLTSNNLGSSANNGTDMQVSMAQWIPNAVQSQHRDVEAMVGQNQTAELQNQNQIDELHVAEASQPGNEDAMDDNIQCFFANDYDNIIDDTENHIGSSNRNPAGLSKNKQKGFNFQEIGCFNSSNGKIFCCNFSTNGKFLASAGHQKKVSVWSTESFNFISSTESHSLLITDIAFRPYSSTFATSSFDKTIKIWDATRLTNSQVTFAGHTEQVMSLDFHPKRDHILCSCDTNNEIRYWDLKTLNCLHISKGGTAKVRFQPPSGNLLATAAGKHINLIDVETDCLINCLEGHDENILSICWDPSGKYIASVTEDSARLWTLEPKVKCVKELRSYGNKFRSCAFHPGHSLLLVIGAYQTLELWKPVESNRAMSIPAHKGVISSVVNSVAKGMIASSSQCVKLWK